MKEKSSFESKGMVNPVVIRRCIARSSRNCFQEVTGGTSLCTTKPSKWHERWLEVLARATSSTHKSTLCPQWSATEGEGGILGPGLLGLDEPVVMETKIGARNSTRQP